MIRSLLVLALLAGLCPPLASAQSAFENECARIASQPGSDSQRLQRLFELDWKHAMETSPEFATDVGYPGQNAKWSDLSPEAIAQRKRELDAPFKVIQSINRSALNAAEQLNYDLFQYNLKLAIEGRQFPDELMPVSQLGGVQQDPAHTLEISPRATVNDYHDILARLNGLPKLIKQVTALMKQGVAAGVTPPRITLRDVPQQIKSQMAEPDKNALLEPFNKFPPEITQAQQETLRQQALAVLKGSVIPAYAEFYNFFVEEYLPHTRESISMSDLPQGKAWYAYNVRSSTTTALTPQQIHELGLSEVKRIRQEMDEVIAQTGFKGSFAEFSKFLRTDPRFFYTDAENLLRGYRDIAKRADPELARLFGKLPQLPYGVKAVPAYSEASQTTAYYEEGSMTAGRPGWFYANTYALDTRPKWEMEALTLHEAVPGHHLQISLAEEMEGVPEFRKYGGYTAFVEGWGLYAESLGTEMGFYKDPYSKYGQLTYEMWRAIRLVIDTGLHSLGWSRQQALDYFIANSSKTEHDITVEVDRYIVWPGQATAYKIGELKFKELRAYATKQLGDKFDVRKFHDCLLENGAVPLDIVDRHVRDWVARSGAAG